MSIAKEFPDFDLATLPPIPYEWTDVSWCNDACPSFAVTEEITVYIDYANPEDREIKDWDRFFIQKVLENGETICELMTNDWDTVLDFFRI